MASFRSILAGLVVAAWITPVLALGDPVTLSGIVSYDGPYSGDVLYVAVVDTAGGGIPIYEVKAYPRTGTPFSQAFSFVLDNAFAPPVVWIAALLDVDGGGFVNIGDADILGWYDGPVEPILLSTTTSHTNVEFLLPTGEIHGDVFFAPGQTAAEMWISPNPGCADARITRPGVVLSAAGAYALIGIYPGTYCLFAYGEGGPSVPSRVCYGDMDCAAPTLIRLEEDQILQGADLYFTVVNPVRDVTWGRIKAGYR